MKITRELMRQWNACYTDEKIASLVPEEGLAPLEIANLDIPVEDRLRVLLREDVIPSRDLRLLACGWAESACAKTGRNDKRSLEAIAVARRFADGEATDAELAAARSAAWAAAADSEVLYSAAARSAAWAAGWSPWLARSAAEASAEARAAAAWSAAARGSCSAWVACSEAEVAAWAEQLADAVRVIKRLNEAAKAVGGC